MAFATPYTDVGPVDVVVVRDLLTDIHTLVHSNGTTEFGKVKGGTPLGKITATSKVRPCGHTFAQAGALAAIDVDDASCFFVGDLVDVISEDGVLGEVTIDGDGAGTADIDLESKSADGLAHTTQLASPTLGVLGTIASIDADGGGTSLLRLESIDADGLAHTIELVNPAGAHDLEGSSVIDLVTGVEAVVITLAHSGAALTSTVAEVLGCINASSQKLRAFAHAVTYVGGNVAAAVASTPLAGGVEAPADKTLRASSTLSAADVETLVVTLGLNAAGTALASTVNEVIGCINASSQKQEARLAAAGVGTNTAAAVAATPLAGGLAVGGKLATGSLVSVVDKTSSPNVITIAGAVTVVTGDHVQLADGAETAIGILVDETSTWTNSQDEDGASVHADKSVRVLKMGAVDESLCTGIDTQIKADLPTIAWL